MLTVIVRSVFKEDGKYTLSTSFFRKIFVWGINARIL